MSLSTLLSFLFGFGLFFGSIAMSTNNYWSFFDIASMLMVLGGTLAAAFISFQTRYVILALKSIGGMFKKPVTTRESMGNEVMQLIQWGYVVQTKGLPALEAEVRASKSKHQILRFGDNMVATGYEPQQIREMLETMVHTTAERDLVPAAVLKNMAQTSPAFGMIGTLVGLIIMLQSMGEDMSNLGQGMSLALITTLYGVVLARLIFLPAALKLEQKEEIAAFRNSVLAEGLVLLAEKRSPRLMQDRLNSFLDPAVHFNIDGRIK